MKRPIAAVVGTGRGLPAHVMTNHDFASIGIETSHEWIMERSGISERRVAKNGETTASMGSEAARHAMAAANVHPGEVDVIVLSTATPDRLLPANAVDIQAELGATRAAAFDVGAACAGWLYAMSTAEGLIMSGTAETALVIGSEKMSAIVDWTDRATCVLFGDGAGAAVLKRSRHHGKGIGAACKFRAADRGRGGGISRGRVASAGAGLPRLGGQPRKQHAGAIATPGALLIKTCARCRR